MKVFLIILLAISLVLNVALGIRLGWSMCRPVTQSGLDWTKRRPVTNGRLDIESGIILEVKDYGYLCRGSKGEFHLDTRYSMRNSDSFHAGSYIMYLGAPQRRENLPTPITDAYVVRAWLANEGIPGLSCYEPLPFNNVVVAILVKPDEYTEGALETIREMKNGSSGASPKP